MKIFFKTLLITIFFIESLSAENFNDALKRAYETNPELNAEREIINISEQDLKISKS